MTPEPEVTVTPEPTAEPTPEATYTLVDYDGGVFTMQLPQGWQIMTGGEYAAIPSARGTRMTRMCRSSITVSLARTLRVRKRRRSINR